MPLNSPTDDGAETRSFKRSSSSSRSNRLNGAMRLNETKCRNDLNGEPQRTPREKAAELMFNGE